MIQGAQSETGRITRILLKHAKDAFDAGSIREQWQALGYLSAPDPDRARTEYDGFLECFESLDVSVHLAPPNAVTGLDSVYVRDAAVLCDRGAILCAMGKEARRSEPAALEPVFRHAGIPVHGTIEPPGTLEGGDFVWLNERTAAVGRGYRTNDEGIAQLRKLTADCAGELIDVPLPHFRGPADVFHLMSIISPVAPRVALVYSPLLPVAFRELLLERGLQLIEAPEEEFDSLGCNVLAVEPGVCLAVEGNPETHRRLRKAGVDVRAFSGREICLKGQGGPTCLTRPLEWVVQR